MTTKDLLPLFRGQRVELQPPSAAAGDDRKRLLVADLHLAADAAADVQAALVDRPSADEIAAGDGKNGGILAFGGELRRFGKGNVLRNAADTAGILRQVKGADHRDAVQCDLVPGGFLRLDDRNDGGFEELENVGAVVREEIVQLDRLHHRGVQDGFADIDGVLGKSGLGHGIILSFLAVPHPYAAKGQNMPGIRRDAAGQNIFAGRAAIFKERREQRERLYGIPFPERVFPKPPRLDAGKYLPVRRAVSKRAGAPELFRAVFEQEPLNLGELYRFLSK